MPAGDFGHRQHLEVTWLYLQSHGLEQTAQAVREGIRRLAAANGLPQLYHETLTRVWIHLVAWAKGASGAATFEDLLAARPELLDRTLPQRFYSAELLQSAEAKAGRVEPDRSALPALRDRMPED